MNARSHFERWIAIISSIITIANFLTSIPKLFGVILPAIDENIKRMSGATANAVVLILEFFLSYFFGILYRLCWRSGTFSSSLVGVWVCTTISAWITLFNVTYIIKTEEKWLLMYLTCTVIASLFTYLHVGEEVESFLDDRKVIECVINYSVFSQIVIFFFMYAFG
jgi:hypothetical protein